MPKCKLHNCDQDAVPNPEGKNYCSKHLFSYRQRQNEQKRKAAEYDSWPPCVVDGCKGRVNPAQGGDYCPSCISLIGNHEADRLLEAEARRATLAALGRCKDIEDVKRFLKKYILEGDR